MKNEFNSRQFINDVAEDIVNNFDRASRATTPGLKGAARENEIRNNLQCLLPTGVGVGSGCVIDHEGKSSKQQDIIIYEKDLCPVFSISNTPETTYYPCEGVIAVGEIKSSMGKAEIIDSFGKIQSVKSLKRLAIPSKAILSGDMSVSFRHYLSMQAFECSKDEQFNQEKNSNDQIFGFILCGDFSIKENTVCQHVLEQTKSLAANLLPNVLASLKKGVFSPYDEPKNSLCNSVFEGTGYVYGSAESGSFEYLLTKLHQAIRRGRTVEVSAFEKYIIQEPDKMTINVAAKLTR